MKRKRETNPRTKVFHISNRGYKLSVDDSGKHEGVAFCDDKNVQMVSQISLEREVCPRPENIGDKDGEPSVPASLQDHDAAHMPAPKQTRQWAAWTRQEEEKFFAALRQVGKNFEKITSRVQSKNKDQVRHYYYRLVRRMNKLLGPELCLDAKNSKDTIAAMLRWWSLLEKYSCKASKLHLKPRRFKIFIEALENQLQRDRKKNVRKRPSTGEDNSSTDHGPAPAQGKVSGHDNRAAKTVLGDSQNVQKVGTGKGSLLRRNVNIGTNRNNCKGDSTSTKTEKKRKKTGLVATTAYKRWEKAAIAGVSLVADAAEHLERVNTDKETELVQETSAFLGHDDSQHVEKAVYSLPVPPQYVLNENNNNQNSTKLKLQLFPIDDCTRIALEMDNHNPHLELTLSTRKKISSVMEHLNRKWGNSRLLSQELLLFPYWANRENLVVYQKWTKDSPLCAADVYYLIGSPPVFRLRYGWFSKAEIELATAQALSCPNQNEQGLNINIGNEKNSETNQRRGSLDDQFVFAEQMTTFLPTNTREYVGSGSNVQTGALAGMRQVENTKDVALSAGDWADSLTSISVGELLSESIQQNMEVTSTEFPLQSTSNFQQMPFSCDSFDAAIAAHIYKHQNKFVDLQQQGLSSHGPSIWDAEETCDAFAFQKRTTFCDQLQDPFRNVSPRCNTENPSESHNKIEELTEMEKLTDVDLDPTCENLLNECTPVNTSYNSTKDFGGLTDIYWPDSLGPLDLDIPSRKYHSEDLILSDSLGGLSRLIANSMDAFQSCSFLGLDKKEATTASTVEARPPASFSDFKISSEV